MGRAASRTQRLDTSVTDAPTVEKAQRLMAVLGTGNADLYRGALDVFDWCVRQRQEGRHIASIDESGNVVRERELSTPLLEAAARITPTERSGHIVLHGEAFDQVTELLDRPAQPTPALRALMADAFAR